MRLLHNKEPIQVANTYKLPDVCGSCILQSPSGHDDIVDTHPPNLMSPSRAPLPPIKADLTSNKHNHKFITHWTELQAIAPGVYNSRSPRHGRNKREHKYKETITPSAAHVFQISVNRGLEALTHSIQEETRKLRKASKKKLNPTPAPVAYWSRYLPSGGYTGPIASRRSCTKSLFEPQKPRPCSIHMPKVDYMFANDEEQNTETSSVYEAPVRFAGLPSLEEEDAFLNAEDSRDSISQVRPPSLMIPDTDDWIDRHKQRHSQDDKMQRVKQWLFE